MAVNSWRLAVSRQQFAWNVLSGYGTLIRWAKTRPGKRVAASLPVHLTRVGGICMYVV